MTEPIVEVRGGTITQEGRAVLENVSFALEKSEFAYLVGRTGAGTPASYPHAARRASLPSRRIHPLPGRAPHPSASALAPGRRARDRPRNLRISRRPRAPHRAAP